MFCFEKNHTTQMMIFIVTTNSKNDLSFVTLGIFLVIPNDDDEICVKIEQSSFLILKKAENMNFCAELSKTELIDTATFIQLGWNNIAQAFEIL